MTESLMQVYLGEDNMTLMKKAAGGANQTIKMKDGKLKMDSFTASAIMAVYNAVNPKNKKSIEKMINSGSKSQIMKLQSLAMKQIKSSYEEVDLDEKLDKDDETVVKKIVGKLKKASQAHAGQSKELQKAIDEDGHTDVASAVRKCMTITEDAQDINSKLQTMSTEDSLPSWWTNKLAVASNDMNKMRDYIVNPVQEEVELDEVFDFVLLDKDNKIAGRYSGSNAKKEAESGKKSAHLPPMSIPKGDVKKMKIVPIAPKDKKGIGDTVLAIGEEVELDEAKYEIYHKDFSSAMQHATKMAKKLHGITIDPKEIDDKVATGPSKPSSGKTNTYRLKGDRGAIQVQVYNKGGSKPFELNMYKEEVELDEKIAGLVTKAKKSGMPYGILKKVYDRGMAAYKTGHRPGTTAQQQAFARVNSFTTKSAGTWGKADKDLAKQVRGESVEEEVVEAVSMAQQAAIAISKKERGEKPKKKNEDAKMNEQPEHEITVGGYTTKHFYMCGTAQKVMSKNADTEGAEEITKLQDDFYKLEKSVMDAGSATDGQKVLAKEIYNKIMKLAGEAGLADDISGYMKQHLDSVEKGDPKPGFGRTDMKEEVDLDEASARADAMRAMRRGKEVDPADVDTDATDDDVKSASKNIIMQLRKSVSLRGNFPVEFMDKKKVKVSAKIAQAVQNKHNSMKRASDKEKFQSKIAKSYKDMLSALKEGIDEAGYVGRKDPMPAGKELAKLMKKKGKNKKENTILDRVGKKLKEIKNG